MRRLQRTLLGLLLNRSQRAGVSEPFGLHVVDVHTRLERAGGDEVEAGGDLDGELDERVGRGVRRGEPISDARARRC